MRTTTTKANALLWTAQALLAALFLFAGGVKLVLPIAALTSQMALPGWFLRFIGLAEVCGAIGLVLPWLTGIRRGLTPLAAAGLAVIMIGATVLTVVTNGIAPALFPLVVGVLLGFVAQRRSRALPSRAAASHSIRLPLTRRAA